MSRIVVVNNITLDGVMQAPGRPDEDTRDVLRRRHEGLIRIAPTLGAQVSLAAVVAHVDGPFWATREHLLADAGESDAGAAAYAKARSARLPGRPPAIEVRCASRGHC